jgi:hypothetical protein
MESSKQQTAVDWLFEQIPAEWSSSKSAFDAYQQAKQMMEEQIIKANRDGVDMSIDNKKWKSGQQYYNQTFGK